jgi:hypothetical protein
MKFLLALFLVVMTFTVRAQGYGRNYIDATGAVKSRIAENIVVVNSASTALTVGEAVCLDLTDDNGISVDYCAVAGYKPLCVIKDTSCAVGARCACQTKGYFSNAQFAYISTTAATAGQVVYASVDGSVYSIGDAAPLNHANKFPVGVALDARNSAGDLEIYIDL